MNGLNCLAKDNTSLHWPHLFIGAEGSLGVVTKVSLACPVKMASSFVTFLGTMANSIGVINSSVSFGMFLACKNFSSCLQVLRAAKKMLGEILSSCEFIDAAAMQCVVENIKWYSHWSDSNDSYNCCSCFLRLKCPFDESFPFYLLLEVAGSNATHDEEKLNTFLESLTKEGHIENGIVATDGQQIQVQHKKTF